MDFSLLTSSIGLIAVTLRPSRGDVVGESARSEYGSALVREAVPTRLAGAAASATMGAMREVASSVSVRRRVALIVWLLCVVSGCATVVLLLIGPGRVLPSDIFSGVGGASFLILALTFAFVGVVVARRVPENRIGWIFLLTALVNSVQLLSWQYADVGVHATNRLPGAYAATVVDNMSSEATAGLLGVSLLMFPTGRLPSRRWLPALASLLVGMALLVLARTLRPGRYDQPFARVSNPFGLAGARGAMDAVDVAGWLLVVAGIGLGALAMMVRLRRASGVERQQLKVVLAVASVAATVAALIMGTWLVWPAGHLQARMAVLGICFATVPLVAGFAILRYRLYEIDIVVNRALVYATITVILGAAFTGTVLLLGTGLGRGSRWATAAATLVVALAFRPLRARVQDVVDRRFNRARYDALQQMGTFLEDLRAGRAAPEAIEGTLRRIVSDARLELLFFLPESELYANPSGLLSAGLPKDGRQWIPVERGGQPLALVLHDRAADEDPTLLRRVVEAGGLAIEIAGLRVGLRRQLAEVEASRARIVTAANEERRRIERDLHDGAQQRLVSIGLALRHAQHELATSSPGRAGHTLEEALTEITVAIDELRELTHGLPPAQLDAGLGPAFSELARRTPIPVDVKAPGERFDPSLEAAAYFIACEGLTNAVKHAQATKVVLSAARRNSTLVVSIGDDGVGGAAPAAGSGLSGLSDRVDALGGTLRLESEHGRGTTLVAEFPCAS
jgi:signal transduction histidine kinase